MICTADLVSHVSFPTRGVSLAVHQLQGAAQVPIDLVRQVLARASFGAWAAKGREPVRCERGECEGRKTPRELWKIEKWGPSLVADLEDPFPFQAPLTQDDAP